MVGREKVVIALEGCVYIVNFCSDKAFNIKLWFVWVYLERGNCRTSQLIDLDSQGGRRTTSECVGCDTIYIGEYRLVLHYDENKIKLTRRHFFHIGFYNF